MLETLLEMPLAARLFIVFVVVAGLISLAAYVIHRAVRSRQPQRHQTLPLQVHSYSHGPALVFKILFWIHQVLLGLPSALISLDLLLEGDIQESSRQSCYFSHGLGARLYGAWLH